MAEIKEINMMTGFLPDSPIIEQMGMKHYVYCTLASAVTEQDDCFFSVFTKKDFVEYGFSAAGVEKALVELKRQGYIKMIGDDIQIGEIRDGKDYLYIDALKEEKSDLIALMSLVEPYYKSYKEAASKRKRESKAIDCYKGIKSVLSKRKLNNADFATFYRLFYEMVFQEEHREFQVKEMGQMKNFSSLYSTEDTIRMMITYLSKSSDFSKYAPSLGTLLTVKDSVYSSMKGISKTFKSKEYMREVEDVNEY